MNQPKPIVNTLFRFVSLRTPQLINPQKKEFGFIYHPNPEKSQFLSKADPHDINISRANLKEFAGAFKALQSSSQIREINEGVYDFGIWLARNRKKLPPQRLLNKAMDLTLLSQQQRIAIWDNLFSQLLRRSKSSLRQASILMLTADNFIDKTRNWSLSTKATELYDSDNNKLSEQEKKSKLVKRIAHAKIIVPKAFSVPKDKGGKRKDSAYGEYKELDLSHVESLYKYNRVARLKQNNADLVNIQRNLKSIAKGELAINREITVRDFLARNEESLGSQGRAPVHYLNKPENNEKLLAEAYSDVNDEIIDNNREYRDISSEMPLRTRRGQRRTSLSDVQDYCYALSFDFSKTTGYSLVISFKLPDRKTVIQSLDLQLKADNQIVAQSRSFQEIEERNRVKSYLLFSDESIEAKENAKFTLSGTVSFNTDKNLSLNQRFSINNNKVYGCPERGNNTSADYDFEEEVPLYGVSRVGVGVFRRVEQEVCCYVPGEVSRIENIMAREYKERHTRSLTSTEDVEEASSDYEIENQTDTTTTIRNELQTEVAKVLDKSNTIGTGADVGVSGKYPGGLEVSANGYLDFAMANASSESDLEAKTYAEEMTNTAVERILQRTSQKRASKIIKEFEENNRHGFDNRQGDKHVTGVYRWIDIIYTNRLVNYGNRLMVEFLVPEPARLYKDSLIPKKEDPLPGEEDNSDDSPPTDPADFGIITATDVEGYNNNINQYYEVLADEYGVSLPPPPETTFSDSLSFVKSGLSKTKPFSERGNITIPQEYRCKKAFITGWFRHDSRKKEGTNWVIEVGGAFWKKNLKQSGNNDRTYTIKTYHDPVYPDIWGTSTDGFELIFNNYQSQIVDIALSGDRTLAYTVNVELICEPSPDEYFSWQQEVFDSVMAAYEEELKKYEVTLEDEELEKVEAIANLEGGNPAVNRSIEQRELKRVAIEMLTKPFYDPSFPFKNRVGADFYEYNDCDKTIPSVKQNMGWENYSSHVKFFEQAFDWKLMAYLFYPYYWANKCDWMDLMTIRDVKDTIFKGFLQSGMARMVVPVRMGFENAVNYYFETGDIWNGGDLVLDTNDDLYLSIDDELAEPEGFVDEEWQTRVPTTLTIIQGDSVYLDDEGLPCCDKLTDQGVDTLLQGSTNILSNVLDEEGEGK
ncbi:MAG: hypothetical protein GY702_08170 [Desulfobulbaceae bacterium]|nr:hypothetical protein [Desulfobulbaceae bacterium]